MHSTDIQWSAILSWGYADNILRLKSKQSEPPINFIQCSQLHQVNLLVITGLFYISRQSALRVSQKADDFSFLVSNCLPPLLQVTSCAWVPDGCQLFTGSKCGVITAYSNRFTSTTVGFHGDVPL